MKSARRGSWAILASAACVWMATGALAGGQKSAGGDPGTEDVGVRAAVEIPVTVAGAALWFGSEAIKSRLAPSSCRFFCAPLGMDRSVRSSLRWSDPKRAWHASDAAAFAGVPLVTGGLVVWMGSAYGARRNVEDLTMVTQGAVASALLSQAVKFAAGRVRPYAAQPSGVPPAPRADDRLSFYSGHTSLAFSFVAASYSVAVLRGYRDRRWIWIAGLPLAATAGYLRIAGDKHWFSDVAVGASVGTLVGAAVPWLLHGRRK